MEIVQLLSMCFYLQSMTDIALLVFWFYFFVKNMFFFRIFIFQWIRYSNVVVFWLRNRPSIKYVRNWRNGGESSKMCTGAYRERGVSCLMCTYALTDNFSFHAFVLRCLVITFIKKGVFLYTFESPQKAGIRFS